MEPIKFQLSAPIEFAQKGELVYISELDLIAPTHRQRPLIIRLKQMVKKSLHDYALSLPTSKLPSAEMDAPSTEDTGPALAGDLLIEILYLTDIDLVKFFDTAKELLGSGTVTVGGEKFGTFSFQKLSDEDFERLVGDYVANFILTSMTK